MIGKTISHYKILKKLGEGGMGEVYLAKDLDLERKVAIKFLPPHLTKNRENVKRFKREAKAAASLNHPNIVTIHEIGAENDQTYIVMENVDGESLRTKIENGVRDLNEVLEIAKQICKGLSEAHKADIVHRDIKPENIVIDSRGHVKILDFGIAKLKGSSKLTKETSTLGTIQYMSPEQALGEELDCRSDIWSMGVVLYEILTGDTPFEGEYDQAVIYSILNDEPEELRINRSNIPIELEQIVIKSLVKEKENRYQDIAEILTDLKKVNKSASEVQPENPGNSIAVLPFVNMSADEENEYFSDGLTEELITWLSRLKDFQVVARTSAFAFKGKELDIREIGGKLNVDTILEGSVRKAGNKIRITAQLINVEDGYHLWSERYDRDLEDIFVIQDEIAREIANRLKTTFRKTPVSIADSASPDMGAYELYLKGRHYFYKFSPEWVNKAIDCFSNAIAMDPNFAPAYTGLADAYIFISTPFGNLESDVAMPKAKEAAEKALSINPGLSEAYVSLGAIATFYDWDSEKAHGYFQKAIKLNPNNANARLWYELTLSLLDQNFDEALTHLTTALSQDPLNLLLRVRIAYNHCYRYDFKTAIKWFKEIIQAEPDHPAGHHGLTDLFGLTGDYESAIRKGEMAVKLSNYGTAFVAVLGVYCARGGDSKRAKELLSILLERNKADYVSPFWIAVIYMGLEEFDMMYDWFDKALAQRDGNLLYLFAPPFDPIRDDRRFVELRQKMGFKE
jgi:serine/threonine protein kinase/Tfp pilus assembly protein PilF